MKTVDSETDVGITIMNRKIFFVGASVFRRILTDIFKKPIKRINNKLCASVCVGGQTVRQMIKRIKKVKNSHSEWYEELSSYHYSAIMPGINDSLKNVSTKRFKRDLKWLLREVKMCNNWKGIILCTLPPQMRKNKNLIMFNNIIRNIAKSYQMKLVDLNNLLTIDDIGRDGLHPHRNGLKKILELIMNYLK